MRDTESLKAEYAALPQGDGVTSKGETYVQLPDVRAMPASSGPDLTGVTVLERKGPFVVYRETNLAAKAAGIATAQVSGTSAQPLLSHAVVLNPRTGNVGVVLGTIIVKLADTTQAESLAKQYGLALTSRFDHLNLVFFTAAPGQDIAAATAALRADPRVTSADPEILENPRVPN